jgi:predicted secreted protein
MTLPKSKGRAFLLKISNGDAPPIYQTAAGFRVTGETIEPQRVSITASGIFLGSASEMRVRSSAMAGVLDDYELAFDDGQRMRGKFLIQRLDYAGDLNGERSYSIHLESSGEVMS